MQTSKLLTKLLVILALGPSFTAAEGLWSGLKAGAASAYERGRSLSLDALAAGADLAAKGIDRTAEARSSVGGESADVAKHFGRGISIYRVTESGMRLEATLFGTRFWPDEALNESLDSGSRPP
jgi:hypothetical protein